MADAGARAAAALLVALALLAGSLSLSPAAAAVAGAPVAPEVRAELARSGQTSFWVRFDGRPRLAAAAEPDWGRRGRAVVAELQRTADDSQDAVRRLLTEEGVDFTPFWAVNAIKVTAGPHLVDRLAAMPGVAEINADHTYERPEPLRADDAPVGTQAVGWNVERVRAPEVWSELGTRGEGIVVGDISYGGVQFDHPALVDSYRGNNGDGTFDHDYNWYDPYRACGVPVTGPCDRSGNGSFAVGTMVGDDHADNQIGVAPGARWISAFGCFDAECSLDRLLGSGQWMLAPTDLLGRNPRPDLRPNVLHIGILERTVDPLYRDLVRALVAAGIFPVFPAGDRGPGCGTVAPPGDYPESYSVGAFDAADQIAGFSSRGPSTLDGSTKPDIAAPGVDVRSSVPDDAYLTFSSTGTAASHVAATVALMWSAAPSLIGRVEETRTLLDQTAVDRSDLSCGGVAGDDNTWGEGALDAFRAVEASPRAPVNGVSGVVTDAATGAPVAGARVHMVGPVDRSTITRTDGTYRSSLPPGTYTVDVDEFGYRTSTATLTVAEGSTAVLDVALVALATHLVSGTVRDDDGDPVAGAEIRFALTPLPVVTTGPDGSFGVPDVPEGEYEVEVTTPFGCLAPRTLSIAVTGDLAVDVTLAHRPDGAGYTCDEVPADYIEAATVLPLSGIENMVDVELPFPFWMYGHSYTTANVSTQGYLDFVGAVSIGFNYPIPFLLEPNAAVYGFWDQLYVDEEATVRTTVVGEAPDRRFVVEWRDVTLRGNVGFSRFSFEIALDEKGSIEVHYRDIESNGEEQGESAAVGIENTDGTDGIQYSFHQPALRSGLGIRYTPPPSGFVQGRVTDAADGAPLAGADVRALAGGAEVATAVTAANGSYLLRVPEGTYTVEASLDGQGTETATVVVDQVERPVVADLELSLAVVDVGPDALTFIMQPGRQQSRTVTIGNQGRAPLEVQVGERPVRTSPEPERVLLLRDALPFQGSNATTQVLDAEQIPYDIAGSLELPSIDLTRYQAVIVSNEQPQVFYDAYVSALPQLTAYVEQGGFLWMGAVAWGTNFGSLTDAPLPGGGRIQYLPDNVNDVVAPDHPAVEGVPDPFTGIYEGISYAAFTDLPAGTEVIARGVEHLQPTLVEYGIGHGRVLVSGQPTEAAFDAGSEAAPILGNVIRHARSFDPFIDVPWLRVAPAEATVAPGETASVTVSADTTGLAAGVHRARLTVVSNDPRAPRVRVPVTVVVPSFQVAVDVGATGPFTDPAGDTWAADRRYTVGSWGYTNGRSSRMDTGRAISGTGDDRLFQTTRGNPLGYRFDDVPDGVYEVELLFAETNGRRPGRRQADVVVEQSLVLERHDISAEVGTFAADRHVVLVPVTDGQLDVRFVEHAGLGKPIVSALRVTHRPDL